MIEPNGDGKFVVRLRQGLKTPELTERFVTQLQEKIESKRAEGETLVFEDLDISQNKVSTDSLEAIFSVLADGGVHVERFRAFGCPTLDDQAATLLAGWLAGVSSENAPFELHLSDCAITTDGYVDLVKALEENEAFPVDDPKRPGRGKLPLYVRLENNYIDEAAMKQSVDDGVAMKMRKSDHIKYSDTVKVRLLVRENGTFQQNKGDPPAPEDVPDPRPYREKGKGKGRGSSKGASRGSPKGSPKGASKGSPKGSGRDARPAAWTTSRSLGKGGARVGVRAPWQALPAPERGSRASGGGAWKATATTPWKATAPSASARSGAWGSARAAPARAAPAMAAPSRPAPSRPAPSDSAPYNAFARSSAPRSAGREAVARQPLRSTGREAPMARQPVKRFVVAAREEPAKRQRTVTLGAARLPPNWEEHYSDQYKLNYYWNSRTGESAWERPRR